MEYHPSVLVQEVVEFLRPVPGGVYLDATCGTAGHSLALLERCGEARIVAIERDPSLAHRALLRVRQRNVPVEQFSLVEGTYGGLRKILADRAIDHVDGCLFDLGANALHFHISGRGFSFRGKDEPLDMRFNPEEGEAAWEVLERASHGELARIFRELGDEKWAGRIASRILERRTQSPLKTAGELATLVEQAIPRKAWPPETHPATRIFQSLRIYVNGEFEQIRHAMPEAIEVLKPGGRLAVISFHSGEDRLIKNIFREAAGGGEGDPLTGRRPEPRVKLLTRKPVLAREAEVDQNPGSRSAKLRVVEKL